MFLKWCTMTNSTRRYETNSKVLPGRNFSHDTVKPYCCFKRPVQRKVNIYTENKRCEVHTRWFVYENSENEEVWFKNWIFMNSRGRYLCDFLAFLPLQLTFVLLGSVNKSSGLKIPFIEWVEFPTKMCVFTYSYKCLYVIQLTWPTYKEEICNNFHYSSASSIY